MPPVYPPLLWQPSHHFGPQPTVPILSHGPHLVTILGCFHLLVLYLIWAALGSHPPVILLHHHPSSPPMLSSLIFTPTTFPNSSPPLLLRPQHCPSPRRWPPVSHSLNFAILCQGCFSVWCCFLPFNLRLPSVPIIWRLLWLPLPQPGQTFCLCAQSSFP